MNRLILLTHHFPYDPPIEQFLHAEFPYLQQVFDHIVIIPIARDINSKNIYAFDKKNSIEIWLKKRKNLYREMISGSIKSIFDLNFLRSFYYITSNLKLFGEHPIRQLFREYVQAHAYFSRILSTLKCCHNEWENDSILIYSYWFNAEVILGMMLKDWLEKNLNKKIVLISRAHGLGDVYRDRQKHYPGYERMNIKIDMIIPISDNAASHLIKSGIKRQIIETHRLGVDSRKFDFELLHDDNSYVHLVSCSSIDANKQVEKILETILHVRKKQSRNNQQLKIRWDHFGAGHQMNDLIIKCRNAESHDLMVQIKLHGLTLNERVIQFYQQYRPDLFINVSRIEGIPVSMMEAMSCGIPVIGTNVGGTKEIIHDGYNGWLIGAECNTDELSDVIVRFCALENVSRQELRKNAFRTWRADFCSEVNYKRFSSVLSILTSY